MRLTKVADPSHENLAAGTSFTLTIGGVDHTIEPASSTMNSLADSINSAGLGVRATIVNVGSTASPDYRLSVQGDHYAAMSIDLTAGGTSLLQNISGGAAVEYRVNGVPATTISGGSRSITLAPGVTANLSTVGSTTLTISQTTSGIEDAYNDVVDALDQQRGTNNGPLSGQSILQTLTNALRSMGLYEGSSRAITRMTQFGLSLGKDGHLSFSQSDFQSAIGGDARKAIAFLGAGSQSGFLKFAEDVLTSVNDSVTGSISSALSSLKLQIVAQGDKISDAQTRVDALRVHLNEQMARADAAVASLEQQLSYITGLINATYNLNKANSQALRWRRWNGIESRSMSSSIRSPTPTRGRLRSPPGTCY
ncbi:MAG: flagellar filament capping protein FliD [Acidobacteria bacterium]|nr:flagellar filament capping protein FliD [Acidobacteriota bacterium]